MDLQCFIIHLLVMITISVSPTTERLDGFSPADIYINSSSGTVKVGDSITIKCAIFQHNHSNEQINMYLCKNGVGREMGPTGKKGEYVFYIKTVSELDSGNYSCVYSLNKYPVLNLSASGQKIIHIQVTEPAASVASNYMKFLLFSVGSLLLIGSLVLGIRCIMRSYNKPKNRGERNERRDQLIRFENVQDNTGQFKGSVPVNQAGKKMENNDEMYAYSTIPDIKVEPMASTSDAELPVYSLAQNSAIYSTALRKTERLSYMETEQTAAIYGKVQKKGKG